MLRRIARDAASALASRSRRAHPIAPSCATPHSRAVLDELARSSSAPATAVSTGLISSIGRRGFAKTSRRPPRRVSGPGGRRGPASSSSSPANPEGALQPTGGAAWTEVTDPGTGRTYWWNKATGQTTALGDPRPDGFHAPEPSRGNALTRPFDAHGRPTIGLAMGQMVVFGFGGALGVTFVSAVIAWVTGGGAAGMEGAMTTTTEGAAGEATEGAALAGK